MRLPALILAMLLVFAQTAPVPAQSRETVIGRLNGAQMNQLRERAARGGRVNGVLGRAIPRFKLPSVTRPVTICRFGVYNEVICQGGGESARLCPTSIELQFPGAMSSVPVPVICVGPDANGDCECEFTGGSDP